MILKFYLNDDDDKDVDGITKYANNAKFCYFAYLTKKYIHINILKKEKKIIANLTISTTEI